MRDRNILALDVTPDVDLGPVEQRLHPYVLAFRRIGRELSPKFRRLIFVIPLELRIAGREVSFLRTGWIFVAPDSGDQRVEFVFREHLLKRDRFQFVRYGHRIMRLVTNAACTCFGVDLHDEI